MSRTPRTDDREEEPKSLEAQPPATTSRGEVDEATVLPEEVSQEVIFADWAAPGAPAKGAWKAKKDFHRNMAKETLDWCKQGWYRNEEEEVVSLDVDAARAATRLIPAGSVIPAMAASAGGGSPPCSISVVRASTLEASEVLVRRGFTTCLLNFASGRNPGGGFLTGADAQEESLARVSALYRCLVKPEVQQYYDDNKAERTCIYTDHMILSPQVPVFRAANGQPLPAPYSVGMLTCPAPNLGAASGRVAIDDIKAVRRHRAERALLAMAAGGFDAIVLGAWGCGVFRNDPREVAAEFRALLRAQRFRGAFREVVFAIIDTPTWQVFKAAFEGTAGLGAGAAARAAAPSSARKKKRGSRRWSQEEGAAESEE